MFCEIDYKFTYVVTEKQVLWIFGASAHFYNLNTHANKNSDQLNKLLQHGNMSHRNMWRFSYKFSMKRLHFHCFLATAHFQNSDPNKNNSDKINFYKHAESFGILHYL